jgi:hypothetical protein
MQLLHEPHNHSECGSEGNKKFWEELIACFPLIRHGTHRKPRIQQFVYCCVCSLNLALVKFTAVQVTKLPL